MRRFWIESEYVSEEEVSFVGDLLHHIRDVCRMRVGHRFEVIPAEKQTALLVEVIEIGKRNARAKILEERKIPEVPKPWLHLCISLPKFSTFDLIVEKSVELGIKSIRPLFSEYSFVRSAQKVTTQKQLRWQKIVKSATQQSGRGDLMSILPVDQLNEVLNDFNQQSHAVGLFPYEGEASLSAREAMAQWKPKEFQDIWCFIGSEGGFSEQEVELFQSHGLRPVTLGDQILRVETACLAVASIIKYETGTFG